MERRILYILLIIISAYSIYQKINYNSKQHENNYVMALKECTEVEDSCKGKVIDNIKISNYNDNENYLYDILSEYSVEYYLVIISSIEVCSTCREHTLNTWNDLYKKNRHMPILFIVSELDEIDKNFARQIKANIKGLHIEIPFYFDSESILLDLLSITPYQTPLSIILSHDKKIIAVDKASEFTKERTLKFREFFLALNSYGV
jgi:hypothetical protein